MTKTLDGRESISMRIAGNGAMLMHSTAGMDPLNPDRQALATETSKSAKEKALLANIVAVQKLEWKLGMYRNADGLPSIPSIVMHAAIRDGAKAFKLGTEVTRSVDIDAGEFIPLDYSGPKDLAKMWDDPRFRHTVPVVVGRAKVLRTRPRFENWSLGFTLVFEQEFMRREKLIEIVQTAGRRVGIGDYRPRFGRFDLVEVDGKAVA